MKKYNKYKNSNVEWLGEIPEHWEVKKMKFLGNIYAGINGKKGDDFSKEYSDGIKSFIPFTNICNNFKIDESQYQYVKIDESENQNRVQKNDILFLMSSETLDDIAKNSIYLGDNNELYLNSFCKGFRISKQNVNAKFVNYLFLSTTYRNYFSLVGRGFTRINLKQEFINDAYTLLPKFEEQTTIVNFLDDKTTKIDQAIAIKRKQIQLLKERRQVLINKAVTRGLNDVVKLKDSGVEWIGKIPEHWQIIKNGVLFQERKEPGNENLPLLSVSIHSAVSSEELEDNIRGQIKIEDKSQYKLVKSGDIVFNMMRAWQGAIGSVRITGMVSPAYVVASPKKTFDSNFFEYQYRTAKFIQQMDRVSRGITDFRKRLYWNEFKQLITIFPPVDEQIKISEFISNLTIKTDSIISLKEKEIEKLKEYKMSLIDGVVTGKVRVC